MISNNFRSFLTATRRLENYCFFPPDFPNKWYSPSSSPSADLDIVAEITFIYSRLWALPMMRPHFHLNEASVSGCWPKTPKSVRNIVGRKKNERKKVRGKNREKKKLREKKLQRKKVWEILWGGKKGEIRNFPTTHMVEGPRSVPGK